MLGLIYKDFVIIRKEIISNFLMIFACSILLFFPWENIMADSGIHIALLSGSNMANKIMPILTYFITFSIIGGLQNDLFAHDERRCYHAFVTSTPVTEKGQVRSKYLGALILILIGLVWTIICNFTAQLIGDVSESTLKISVTFFSVQMLLSSFGLPFIIRFGEKKGDTFKMAFLAVLLFFAIVYLLFGPLPEISRDRIFESILELLVDETKLSTFKSRVAALAPPISLILYTLSYSISAKLYPKAVEGYEN